VAIFIAALIAALLFSRRWIFTRWAKYGLSHRQAAVLYAAAVPLVYLAASLINGVSGFGGLLLVLALCVVIFVPTYAFAELMLRYFGGEMDLPTSPSYKRRLWFPRHGTEKLPENKAPGEDPPFA
jgi:hypothetical protein